VKGDKMSLTHETHKKTIAIDVDGVIADYSKGWQGEDYIGDPLPGAKEFLERLHQANWKIIIFTTRGNADMKKYCEKHGLYYDEINQNSSLQGRNPGKPIANLYLDDRGITFTGDFDEAFYQIKRFKVWYEN
jgi:hydroxymethylpyrimidine pyrophosphatase-like HAD family hydrolase